MLLDVTSYGNFIIPKPKFMYGDIAYFITEDRKISAYKLIKCKITCNISDDTQKANVNYMYNVVTQCPNSDYNVNQNILYITKEDAMKALVLQMEKESTNINVVGCG